MSILSDQTTSRKREAAENPSISNGFFVLQPNARGVTTRRVFDWDRTPTVLRNAPPSVRETFRYLDQYCRNSRKNFVWVCDATIAEALDLSKSAIEQALRYLDQKGWIHREQHASECSHWHWTRHIFCLWIWTDGRNEDVDFGHGVRVPAQGTESPPLLKIAEDKSAGEPLAPETTKKKGPGRANRRERPQKFADKVNTGLIQDNVNVNVAQAGEDHQIPEAEIPAIPEPVLDQVVAEEPVAALPPLPSVEECEAKLRGPSARHWLLVGEFVHALKAHGRDDLNPARWQGDKAPAPMPATGPTPDTKPASSGHKPAEVRIQAPQPRTQAESPTGRLEDQQVETLVGHLARPLDAEVRERIVGIAALKIADSWRDEKSYNGFASRLRMIGPEPGQLSAGKFLLAYRQGSTAKVTGTYRPGPIFHKVLRPHLPQLAAQLGA